MELDAGRGEPLPEYVGAFVLAEKLGVRVCRAEALDDVPLYWREAAAVLMRAESLVNDKRAAESRRKR